MKKTNSQNKFPNKSKPKIVLPNCSLKSPTNQKNFAVPKIVDFSNQIKYISTDSQPKRKVLFPSLPLLVKTKIDAVNDLFSKKCSLCFQKCDFSDSKGTQFIIAKEDILREILQYCKEGKFESKTIEIIYKSVFSLIAVHIFRIPKDLPNLWKSVYDIYFQNDEYRISEWIHLSNVYDIGMAFINRDDFILETAGEYATDMFKLLVYLSRTMDEREQKKIAEMILCLYKKLGIFRSFSLRVIASALNRVVFDNDPFTSPKPLLVALTSIAAGFSVPLKPHFAMLYLNAVLPLHKSQYMEYFCDELLVCSTQFLEKDGKLVVPTFEYLVRVWPRLQPRKQIRFINTIALFASFVEENNLTLCFRIVFPQLSKSLLGCHQEISLRVLSMWEISDFVWFVTEKPEDTYPIILPVLFEAAKSHWDAEVREMSLNVLYVMQQNNSELFEAVGKGLKQMQSFTLIQGMKKGSIWMYLVDNYEKSVVKKTMKIERIAVLFPGCEAMVEK